MLGILAHRGEGTTDKLTSVITTTRREFWILQTFHAFSCIRNGASSWQISILLTIFTDFYRYCRDGSIKVDINRWCCIRNDIVDKSSMFQLNYSKRVSKCAKNNQHVHVWWRYSWQVACSVWWWELNQLVEGGRGRRSRHQWNRTYFCIYIFM